MNHLLVVDEQFNKVPDDLKWAIAIKKSYSRPEVQAQVQARKTASQNRLKAEKKEALKASLKIVK